MASFPHYRIFADLLYDHRNRDYKGASDTWRRSIQPLLEQRHEYGSLLTGLLAEESWLACFSSRDSDADLPAFRIMETYDESPNQFTIFLLEYVNRLAADTIFVEWQSRFTPTGLLCTWEEFVESKPWDHCDGDSDYVNWFVMCGCYKSVRQLLDVDHIRKLEETSAWCLLCTRIAQFCLYAGVPSVSNDPEEDITRLRTHIASQGSRSRESQLQAEIERLEKKCRGQQRIITNLSFRHVLESLPGPKPPMAKGKPSSSTEHWQRFWRTAWEKAQKPDAASSLAGMPASVHPLTSLLGKYSKRRVKEAGEGLYGRFSDNIHDFNGEFTVVDDQWDAVEGAILHALTPATERKLDGGVDWEQEKSRYLR